MTRDDALARDAADPLAAHRRAFSLPEGVIYLDGNSLGALPLSTSARVREVIEREWGEGLIRSWNTARWTDLPRRVGAKIARLIGAKAHEVICADSTSINLFKVLAAALHLQAARPQVSLAERRMILSERGNFPTDLYVAQGLTQLLGDRHELRLVDADEVHGAIDETVAVVFLTQVNFKSGAMHDLVVLTRRAHEAGALVVWDLAHSAGAVPVDLTAAQADFAVGCGYKYLNGGPGAPAFVYAAERHLEALAGATYAQPLAGWFGHRTPFEFVTDYAPAATIDRFAVGTPSIIALAALDAGVDTVLAAGMDTLRAKSVALTETFIALVERECDGVTLATPRAAERRGSQVCFAHADAYAVMQALIERGVIGDFRAPDVLRFGFAPLYVRHVDVFDAARALADVLRTDAWRSERFQAPGHSHMSSPADPPAMRYGDYLALDAILDAQHPRSSDPNELLFIVQHQTSELWMKLALHELRTARSAIAASDLPPAFKMLARVSRIMEQLVHAWNVLATMTPSEYSAIRPHLGTSSGFQSWQYREIEFLLGNKNGAMLRPHDDRPELKQSARERPSPRRRCTTRRSACSRAAALPSIPR